MVKLYGHITHHTIYCGCSCKGDLLNRKEKTKALILTVVSVLIIAFIFRNSLQDAEQSTLESSFVGELINKMMSFFGIDTASLRDMALPLRKAAHFTEFFILGTSLYFTFSAYMIKNVKKAVLSLVFGFCVACIDETIQIFSPGRASQFTDVLIDTSGVLCALLIFSLFAFLKEKRKNTKNSKTEKKSGICS